jgi:hypothetical protein
MKRTSIGCMVWICFLFVGLLATGVAQTVGRAGATPVYPTHRPSMVYVTDFELDASSVSEGERIIGRRLPRVQRDPQEEARKLVDLIAESLTRELNDRGIPAKRLYHGQDTPPQGWLVGGELLEVDEGNRLRRAAIGFGAGSTEMLAEVSISDLSMKPIEPFLVCGTGANSGRGPGAIVMMNPYAAAAKFVLSKRAPEKDAKKTARQMADVIYKSIQDIPKP